MHASRCIFVFANVPLLPSFLTLFLLLYLLLQSILPERLGKVTFFCLAYLLWLMPIGEHFQVVLQLLGSSESAFCIELVRMYKAVVSDRFMIKFYGVQPRSSFSFASTNIYSSFCLPAAMS